MYFDVSDRVGSIDSLLLDIEGMPERSFCFRCSYIAVNESVDNIRFLKTFYIEQ